MKTIVAGSRSIQDYRIVQRAILSSGFTITELVSGGAQGVDQLGEAYARLNNILVKKFIPDWNQYGKAAGIYRNTDMAQYAEALIAVWDGKSKGTLNMICQAKDRKLQVFVYKHPQLLQDMDQS
jgi:hypothetical protein